MKKIILTSIVSLLMANLALAANSKVYALVNGDKITEQSIAVALKDPRINFDNLPKETQKSILNKMVEQRLLAQNAIKTDAIQDPIYKSTLKILKQDLALQVWMQKESKKITISDKELKTFYNRNITKFKAPAQLKAKHILVKTKKEAIDIINILKKSKDFKSKFIALAKEKSTGPSGKNGGELGWFVPKQMVAEFSKAAQNLKVNTFTKVPVKTQFGYHIIYLEDKKKASTVSFEKAKFNIKQQIGQKKLMIHIQKFANNLKKKAKIEYK